MSGPHDDRTGADDRAGGAVVEPTLDHLVYATPDLAATVEEFTRATGCVPAEGGRHLGRGTRNVLVGLAHDGSHGQAYLEIIGPDLDHPADPGRVPPFGLAALTAPRLVTWAVHPADPDARVRRAARAGYDPGELRSMSRRTPTGELLTWRLTAGDPMPFDGVVPFVIDWGRTRHPAADPALPAVTVTGFAATHPDPSATAAALAALGVRLPVTEGAAGLTAELHTPQGLIVLR